MSPAKLFIGLITHRQSRFNRDGQAAAAVADLASRLREQGVDVSRLVSDRDDYSAEALPVTRRLLLSSALLQAWIEFRWRRYLAEGRGNSLAYLPRDVCVLVLMTGIRVHSYIGWNWFRSGHDMPGATAVIRLLNIDLSHLRVYEEALESGRGAILVIEDDARAVDSELVPRLLLQLLARNNSSEARFVNLSESIDNQSLGVVGILGESDPYDPSVVTCSRPVTNTVCANLFNREFLEQMYVDIVNRGLTPVIPIDWRVNRFIMSAWKSGLINERTCVWVAPGVFVQGSMHEVGE